VLHFWSLAVEEQFYLTWPLVLTGLFLIARLARRWQWWALRALMGAAVVASAAWALHLATTNLDRAYYGTDARVYQLVAGGLIVAGRFRGRRLSSRARSRCSRSSLVGWARRPSRCRRSPSSSSCSRGVDRCVGACAQHRGALSAARCLPRPYLARHVLVHWPIIVVLTRKIDPAGSGSSC
jgi:hypothetical protein